MTRGDDECESTVGAIEVTGEKASRFQRTPYQITSREHALRVSGRAGPTCRVDTQALQSTDRVLIRTQKSEELSIFCPWRLPPGESNRT